MSNYADKIAKLEAQTAKSERKAEQWSNFGKGVQNWDNAVNRIYDRIDVGKISERISEKIPARVLTINVVGNNTPNYHTKTAATAAGLSGEKDLSSHKTTIGASWQKIPLHDYKSMYNDANGQKRHGILNKIDAHFNYTNEGKVKGEVKGGIRKAVLTIENKTIIGIGNEVKAIKQNIVSPVTDFAGQKIREKIALSDNTNLRAGAMIIGNSARAVRWTVNYVKASSKFERRTPHNALKNFRGNQLTHLYEHKVQKFTRRNELAEAKLNFARGKLNSMSDAKPKLKHKEKKAAWKTISGNDNLVFKHSRGQSAEQMNKSFREKHTMKKLRKAESKLYEKKLVKTKDFNEATGKTRTRIRKGIDTSKPKEFKRKRPDGAIKSLSKAGAAAIQSKAFHQMAQSDNYGVQAAGKIARTSFSQVSRIRAKNKANAERKFNKKQLKAKKQYEKANAKLQVRSSKMDAKRAQKKAMQKRRNKDSFAKLKKSKAKASKAARSTKKSLGELKNKKVALIALGALGVIVVMIVPLLVLTGGSSSVSGYIPVDDNVIAFSESYFDEKVKAMLSDKEKEIRKEKTDVNSVTIIVPDDIRSRDVCQIPAYLTAKHDGEWTKEQAMSDIDELVAELYGTEVTTKEVASEDASSSTSSSSSSSTSNTSDETSGESSSSTKYDYTVTPKYTGSKSTIKASLKSKLSSDGKKEYKEVIKQRGGHQSLAPFTSDEDKEISSDSKDYCTFPGSSLPNYYTFVSGEMEIIASGEGIIKSCSNGILSVTYEDEYTVTYKSSDISASSFSTGNEVSKGDSLFNSLDGVYLSTYNELENCYINPYYIFETHDEADDNGDDSEDDEDDEDEEDDGDDED